MATMTASTVIQRPVEDVFAFMSDARNNPQWQSSSGLVKIQQTPESPVGVGTRIAETRKFMGMTFEDMSEISEFEPNRKVTRVPVSGKSGPIKRGELAFEPVAEGCRVTFSGLIEATGLLSVAEPVLVANIKRSFETSLGEAKAYLESQR